MKKLLILAMLTVCSFTVLNAQGDVRFGASAGINFSGVNGDDTDGTEGRTGFRVGAVVDIAITEKFSVQPVVAISIQGWKDSGFDIKANYVVVEAKADYEVVDGLSLQAGPFVGFNIHASVDQDDITNFESTNIGGLVAVQYELPIELFFNVQYDMGFSELIPNFDARNHNLSISIGKFF
jgi:hypothetical protein